MSVLLGDVKPKFFLGDGKVKKLYKGSDKVWSGGNTVNYVAEKNLLKNIASTETKNGVTFTVNSDGSVTVNGTTTATTRFLINSAEYGLSLSVGETYILSGCPSDGSHSKYRLQFYNFDGESSFAYDLGTGKQFVYANTGTDYNVVISIESGVTVSNITFYPMIRLASIADSSYVPSGDAYLVGAQLLPLDERTETKNGITLTVKGSMITVKGTPTDTSGYTSFEIGSVRLISGTYTIVTDNKTVGIGIAFTYATALNFAMSETITSKTETLSGDSEDIVHLNVNNTLGTVNYNGNWMFNSGTSALPFEPYTESGVISVEVDEGESCLDPLVVTPYKSDYDFTGWSETPDGDVLTEKIMGDEPITLYTVFEPVPVSMLSTTYWTAGSYVSVSNGNYVKIGKNAGAASENTSITQASARVNNIFSKIRLAGTYKLTAKSSTATTLSVVILDANGQGVKVILSKSLANGGSEHAAVTESKSFDVTADVSGIADNLRVYVKIYERYQNECYVNFTTMLLS